MKPNATLVVSDYSAVPGVGFRFAPRLHRIDEAALCKELAAAGFELVASSDLLRNPADSRMTDPVRMAGKTDQFLLKFKRSNKPVSAALMTDNRIVQTGPLDTKGGDETKAVATAASAP